MTDTDQQEKERKLKQLKQQKAKIFSLKQKVNMLKIKILEIKNKYNDILPDLDKI
jgi:hypothetical protein